MRQDLKRVKPKLDKPVYRQLKFQKIWICISHLVANQPYQNHEGLNLAHLRIQKMGK